MNDTQQPVTPSGEAASSDAAAAGFVHVLFGRSSPEDLAHYPPAVLAELARGALAHLATPRQEGQCDIRVFDPDGPSDPSLSNVSIVEVVNDDMPFLLDSTLAELNEAGLEVRLVAHPILHVERDEELRFVRLDTVEGARRESLIHIHVARLTVAAAAGLRAALAHVYADVRVSYEDWPAMRGRVAQAIAAYQMVPSLPREEVAEAVQFLHWLITDNFTFLGLRDYRFTGIGTPQVDAVGSGGLGILRDPEVKVLRRGKELVSVTPEVMQFLQEPQALIIAKANVKSRVHRRVQMDYVGIKLFSTQGRLEGELRVVGLFTASAYTGSTQAIPYVRHKVAGVLARARLDPQSHSGKALTNVLETYPRDELFQADVDLLTQFAGEIAALSERPRLRVLARVDRFDRFVSVLTYIPRDRYDTNVRLKVGEYLCEAYKGRVSATYPFYPEGPLVRTHFIIGHYEGTTPVVPREELERAIGDIVRTWADKLMEALVAAKGSAGAALASRYAAAFSAGYRENFGAAEAIADIATIERLSAQRPRAVVFRASDGLATLKVFSRGRPMPLSERVPVLEHMGFRVISEQTFDVGQAEVPHLWLHHMLIEGSFGQGVAPQDIAPRIEALLAAIFRGDAESDGYDALVVAVGLAWRDIALLRTLSRYLQQARVRYSQDYMAGTLVKNAPIASKLVDYFHKRFDPRSPLAAEERAAQEAALTAEIETLLAAVASLDEDRILRRFLNLIQAAVRTNFFQIGQDGMPRQEIALKFESRRIENLPLPRPLYEITVCSPRVEGVHLRFGKVARGGLRWSDRPQDFRTEVLGLVKAQQVKNAVIVPVGAKGGFVPKQLPPQGQRDEFLAEGIAAYKIFVGALLDLTDNIEGEDIIPPPNTLRHDGDDPYLVVAADKGTASFSDIANAVSIEHGHWLGDAFASGGSAGYDHKKMGITARGAWEAVKRHFREIDVDIQHQGFTVAGVGDMSGDVFGNAMLLSSATRLVAAFDHRDIFLDPEPDPVASFAERARLFALPRSSWQDYDKSLISRGGGVFARSAKAIVLSSEAQARLGLAKERATPQEIMMAILRAPVDLLWFGGIGTYVRASDESDDSVGDRANDALRVTGEELACKVVGEGANLGVTQRGRIEAARRGIRLNSDAIDNSAGVNTSDVEVNIKIALASPVRQGALDEAGRSALLADMTGEVANLVLRNNYQQTLALSLAERRSAQDLGLAQRLMQSLERQGRLSRAVEFLPDDEALAERSRVGEGLVRPELAVLLAYAKLALHDDLIDTKVPDDVYLAGELSRYFPGALLERFPDAVAAHRLRRDIVVTNLANAIVNRCGPMASIRIAEETGADAATLAYAFAATRDIFALSELNEEIDALDARIAGALQLELYAGVQGLLLSRIVWFIRHVDFAQGLEKIIARFRAGVEELSAHIGAIVPEPASVAIEEKAQALRTRDVPAGLAQRLASLETLACATDIVLVGETSGQPVREVAATFFAADAAFGLSALLQAAARLPAGDYYDRLALDAALGQIEAARRRLAAAVVTASDPSHQTGAEAVAQWIQNGGAPVERIRKSVGEIISGGFTLSRATVAAHLVSGLAPHDR